MGGTGNELTQEAARDMKNLDIADNEAAQVSLSLQSPAAIIQKSVLMKHCFGVIQIVYVAISNFSLMHQLSNLGLELLFLKKAYTFAFEVLDT